MKSNKLFKESLKWKSKVNNFIKKNQKFNLQMLTRAYSHQIKYRQKQLPQTQEFHHLKRALKLKWINCMVNTFQIWINYKTIRKLFKRRHHQIISIVNNKWFWKLRAGIIWETSLLVEWVFLLLTLRMSIDQGRKLLNDIKESQGCHQQNKNK